MQDTDSGSVDQALQMPCMRADVITRAIKLPWPLLTREQQEHHPIILN